MGMGSNGVDDGSESRSGRRREGEDGTWSR